MEIDAADGDLNWDQLCRNQQAGICSPADCTDQDLIGRITGGEKELFAELVSRQQKRVAALIYSLIQVPDEVEDRGFVDLLEWFTANYYLLGIGLIGLGILALLNTLGQDLWYFSNTVVQEIIQHLRGYVPPLLLIAAGIYLLRRTKRAEAKTEGDSAVVNTPGDLVSQPERVIPEGGHEDESDG